MVEIRCPNQLSVFRCCRNSDDRNDPGRQVSRRRSGANPHGPLGSAGRGGQAGLFPALGCCLLHHRAAHCRGRRISHLSLTLLRNSPWRPGAGHKNSLWRQTAVVLPPQANVNLFFTVSRTKKIPGKNTETAEFASAQFGSSNGSGEMTIYVNRRAFCVGTALIGIQTISSGAFAARSEDGTVKLGL